MVTHERSLTLLVIEFISCVIVKVLICEILGVRRPCKVIHHNTVALVLCVFSHTIISTAPLGYNCHGAGTFHTLLHQIYQLICFEIIN